MFKNVVKKYYSEGSKINQIIMAALVVLPVLAYGSALGWMSPMALLLQSEQSPAARRVSDETVSWMASVTYIVGTPAVFLFGYLADNVGRKPTLMLTSLSMAICWMLKLASTEPWALISARGLVGLVVAGTYVVTPLYMKEISEDSIRGTLGSLVILSQNLGNVLAYVGGDLLEYRLLLWLLLAVPLVHLALFANMPETPVFLLERGKTEEARSVLAWLRCRPTEDPRVQQELDAIAEENLTEKSNDVSALRILVSDPATKRAFRITVILNLAREVCGCIAIIMFASTIFETARSVGGFELSPNKQTALLGAVQLVGSCFASSLVEKTGRKPLLAWTCAVSGLSTALLGGWFYLQERGAGLLPPWVPVLALCVCIFCDAGGLQPVPFIIMTEIFSFQLRGTVTSLIIAFACALDSAQLRVFKPMADALGMSSVFFIFSGVCLLSTAYILLFVPETKMRSLDDIYAELGARRSCGRGGDVKRKHRDSCLEGGITHL